jgi:UDP-GlcNAc:undecaprenyl-phosphate GlcNAc-1-phosphate transferase
MFSGGLGDTSSAMVSRAYDHDVANHVRELGHQISELATKQAELARIVRLGDAPEEASRLSIFHGYMWVMVVAFVVTLLATPIMRRFAVSHGVIDRPSDPRKIHRYPIAYLGGAAVFLGFLGAVFYSVLAAKFPGLIQFHRTVNVSADGFHFPVPFSVLGGATAIMLTGLIDDVLHISPRIKIAGQLFAAAWLAIDDVGVKVAQGLLEPIGHALGLKALAFSIPLGVTVPFFNWTEIPVDLIYWAGTGIIALFVLGGCNAANLIDGLDGLLSGVTAIANIGLLVIALTLAMNDDGPRDAQRIVICLATLGACLGFLPHNFNPASIFLGDCGSLLLGFLTVVTILTLGDTGKTHLVFAGLIIYSIPILDTTLAIIRRKMAGKKMSDPDDQHLHHMLKRALGVKGAVLALYGIAGSFATLGVLMSVGRARVVYALTLLFASFIIVTAIKIARRKHIEEQAAAYDAKRAAGGPQLPPSAPAPQPSPAPAGARPEGATHGHDAA